MHTKDSRIMPCGEKIPIARLRNIGPASARWLEEAGICTRQDLERVGPVFAYCILKRRRSSVSLNLLYALHAALTGELWSDLSPETRRHLKQSAEEAMQGVSTALGLPDMPNQEEGRSPL